MKIIGVSYRDWAIKIYEHIAKSTNHTVLIIRNYDQYDDQVVKDFAPDLVLYYGWSWKVSEEILDQFPCVMLHPADLPKYRGGSPIQNQIINGVKDSAVTLFFMTEQIDGGDIISKRPLSLRGHIDEIFDRMTCLGIEQTMELLERKYERIPQNHAEATVYKRRTPAESEITLEEIKTKSGEYLFNKIRMLEDPYPNAFITTADGRKLRIKSAEVE